jgi:hypothetical protein
MYKTIILSVVLDGLETWSLTIREEHGLRYLRTGCRGECLDRRHIKWVETGGTCIMRSFITCCLRQIHGVSEIALQWYSKCYCVANVTKTFTLKGVQTIHRSPPWTASLEIPTFVIRSSFPIQRIHTVIRGSFVIERVHTVITGSNLIEYVHTVVRGSFLRY